MKQVMSSKGAQQWNVVQLKEHKDHKECKAARTCNLCGEKYEAQSRFQRFCTGCKEHSELYHFHEWLPAS